MIICESLCKSYRAGHSNKRVLDNVNLAFKRGDRVGLLGRNGAGKTTLLKIIGGVIMPTSGRVVREMSCSWPLGFSGGFQGSLTGYDNARFIARIYDRDYKDLRGFVEEFTELGQQLRMPVKTYSSGMRARLAFGLSLAIEFDCYLVDEVIMVGDRNFQLKCHTEIFEKRHDRALFLATHGANYIREYCNLAVILRDGHAEVYDDIEEALAIYETL
jgi:capsular polysaccharide transport system ATP-binding protein